jgi:site-specific DNA-adenine methylase
MWSYYGAKTNLIEYYPKPKYDRIIEPFAGSARYSLKYFNRDILLIDKYETVINIWKWLQKCSAGDIKKLPRLTHNEKISNYKFDCIEAEDLCGFLVGFSNKRPRKTGSAKLLARPNFMNFRLNQIAAALPKIKHWEIRLGSYEEVANQKATWFIDPPYNSAAGKRYVFNSDGIDYHHLSGWCKEREGQVIVCEGLNANWLPFKPLATQRTNKKTILETVWCNDTSAYDSEQLKMAI